MKKSVFKLKLFAVLNSLSFLINAQAQYNFSLKILMEK
jgi:hypothetical protein